MDLQQGLIPCFFLAMKKFQKDLIDWYIHNHRPLEFRLKKDPYEIWISEIMAQQTRIEAMLPYFKGGYNSCQILRVSQSVMMKS